MKKPIVWRPSTAPSELQAILTVKLPPGTALPPTEREFRQAFNLKAWRLVREAIEAAGANARWEVGEPVKAALPGANVDPTDVDNLEDALMMSDQMTALLGSIDWDNEPAARPLLTKDDLEDFEEQTLGGVLAAL